MGGVNRQMAIALGHPLRVKILRLLEEGPSSPNRMANRMGEELGNVSYHTKALLGCGCIELVETRPARGAVEHFYRLNPQGPIGSANWKEVPAPLRTGYANSSLSTFAERAIEAMEAGTVETRQGSGLTWLPLNLDEQGWRELRSVLTSCEKRSRAAGEKSAERMEGPADGISVVVAFGAFEVPGGEDVHA